MCGWLVLGWFLRWKKRICLMCLKSCQRLGMFYFINIKSASLQETRAYISTNIVPSVCWKQAVHSSTQTSCEVSRGTWVVDGWSLQGNANQQGKVSKSKIFVNPMEESEDNPRPFSPQQPRNQTVNTKVVKLWDFHSCCFKSRLLTCDAKTPNQHGCTHSVLWK